jgi:hypothetical protein
MLFVSFAKKWYFYQYVIYMYNHGISTCTWYVVCISMSMCNYMEMSGFRVRA